MTRALGGRRAKRADESFAVRRSRSRSRLGVIGTVVIAAILALALSWGRLSTYFDPDYRADFSEAGGLSSGDDVVASGVVVGTVTSIDLVGDHVRVSFTISNGSLRMGTLTGAAIETESLLGKMGLVLTPAGPGSLRHGAEIPLSRTVSPYDLTEALSDLSNTASALNVDQLDKAMQTISTTLSTAAPDVGPALEGVLKLSAAINARDEQLTDLLHHSAEVTSLLADHSSQVQTLLADGTQLLAELNERSDALTQLLSNATSLSAQLSGLVADNSAQIGPAFDQLNAALSLLEKNKANINSALDKAGPLVRELGGIVSSFPGIDVYVPNLAATNLVPGLPSLLTGGTQ
jgi:phospholipid/cholesterol/gamma-HCH transport system substrate-binding protein